MDFFKSVAIASKKPTCRSQLIYRDFKTLNSKGMQTVERRQGGHQVPDKEYNKHHEVLGGRNHSVSIVITL